MALLKYLIKKTDKPSSKNSTDLFLPEPNGPLSERIPSVAISKANEAVKEVHAATLSSVSGQF